MRTITIIELSIIIAVVVLLDDITFKWKIIILGIFSVISVIWYIVQCKSKV